MFLKENAVITWFFLSLFFISSEFLFSAASSLVRSVQSEMLSVCTVEEQLVRSYKSTEQIKELLKDDALHANPVINRCIQFLNNNIITDDFFNFEILFWKDAVDSNLLHYALRDGWTSIAGLLIALEKVYLSRHEEKDYINLIEQRNIFGRTARDVFNSYLSCHGLFYKSSKKRKCNQLFFACSKEVYFSDTAKKWFEIMETIYPYFSTFCLLGNGMNEYPEDITKLLNFI